MSELTIDKTAFTTCEFKGGKLVFWFDDENKIEFEKIKG